MNAVERELAEVQEQAAGLRARWQKERGAIGEIAALKEKLETLRFARQEATRKGDLQRRRSCSMGRFRRRNAQLTALTTAQDEAVTDDEAKRMTAGSRASP